MSVESECERKANWEYAKRVNKALLNGRSSERAYELGEEERERALKECLEEANND